MDPVDIGPLEVRLQPQPDEREEDRADEADGDNEEEPGLSALKRRRSDQKAHDAEDLKCGIKMVKKVLFWTDVVFLGCKI